MKDFARSAFKSLLLVCLTFVSPAVVADDDDDSDEPRRVSGTYLAMLDLRPLGIDRIEALGIVLHSDGAVSYNSEHEVDDLESAGVGVWKRLRRGKIGMGVFSYRIGTAGGCAAIFGIVPPDNCVLKLGATLDRRNGGRLAGDLVLTFETLDGVQFSLPPVPVSMERLSLEDFPGALP